jgi:Tol biopolymer transport system component
MRHERDLPPILSDLAMAPYPDYVDDVLGRTGRMRQRPAWTFPGRWLPMDITTRTLPVARLPWRQLGVLALIALLLAVALAIYAGSQRHVPPPFGPARNGLIPYASNGDIYLGDPTTGRTRPLVESPETESGAEVSPDGTRVAFARDVAGRTGTDVYVVDIDGSSPRKITPMAIDHLNWGGWTPDGRQLALIHDVDAPASRCPTAPCTVSQLDLVDAEGSGHIRNLASERGLSYVRFRPPDGHELLYRALVDNKWGLFAMAADGSNVRAVVPATVPAEMDVTFGTAAYSADGSRIFFNQYTTDASAGEPGCCQLFVVNADGSNLHKFIPNTGGAWDGDASVAPDGTRIAFWHNVNDGPAHGVSVIRADGNGPLVETGPPLTGLAHWIWAPDSSAILMFSDAVDTGKAYLLDPAGGPYKTVPWTSSGDLDWQRLAP